MSDKPIYAELVRADEIKAGDRILAAGYIVTVESVEPEPCFGTRGFEYEEEILRGLYCNDDHDDSELVARILPEESQ